MPNTAYLCVSDEFLLYPSSFDPNFIPSTHTVASQLESLPLLWMALFREDDVFEQEATDTSGNEISLWAPLVTIKKGIHQLKDVSNYLDGIFQDYGDVSPHASELVRALETCGRTHVTLELADIEPQFVDGVLRDGVQQALRGFANQDNRANIDVLDRFEKTSQGRQRRHGIQAKTHLDLLIWLSGIDTRVPLPQASQELNVDNYDDEEWANLWALLGTGYAQPAPWERALQA